MTSKAPHRFYALIGASLRNDPSRLRGVAHHLRHHLWRSTSSLRHLVLHTFLRGLFDYLAPYTSSLPSTTPRHLYQFCNTIRVPTEHSIQFLRDLFPFLSQSQLLTSFQRNPTASGVQCSPKIIATHSTPPPDHQQLALPTQPRAPLPHPATVSTYFTYQSPSPSITTLVQGIQCPQIPHSPPLPETLIFMDVEGPRLDSIHELAIVVTQKGYIIDSLLLYSIPPQSTRTKLQFSAKFCHCINFRNIKHSVPSDQLKLLTCNFLTRYTAAPIISNDERITVSSSTGLPSTTDISRLLVAYKIPNPYIALPLSPWITRNDTVSHKLAQAAKSVSFPIPSHIFKTPSICHTSTIHSENYTFIPTTNPSKLARHASGFHCALYDCLEIYIALFLSPSEAPEHRAILVDSLPTTVHLV
jgi:hypothetical protein